MPSTQQFGSLSHTWWQQLGLHSSDPLSRTATENVLRAYRPVSFAPVIEGDGTVISWETLISEIQGAEQAAADQRQRTLSERRAREDADFEASFTQEAAVEKIERGAWKGFTRADATAWCWNLFQFEPHGFVHPASQVRLEALGKLRSGHLPEVFGYPQRARDLTTSGVSPREYRDYRVALGAKTFDAAEVRYR